MKTKNLTMNAVLAAVLAVLGMVKFPGIIPGTEFQLSAPFAVSIAAYFGFIRYMKIGIVASMVNLLLGTHSVLNVVTAMVFRLVVGMVFAVFKVNKATLAVSGPMGTFCARLVLSAILQVNPWVLIAGAIPGMVLTVIAVCIMYPIMKKVCSTMGVPSKTEKGRGSEHGTI